MCEFWIISFIDDPWVFTCSMNRRWWWSWMYIVHDAHRNASFTPNQAFRAVDIIASCQLTVENSFSYFFSELHNVTCTHTHTCDQRFILSEWGDLWTNEKWNGWQALDLPDCHLRTDNTKDNPYVQAAHDTLSHCLRAFLNCKLNIYYPDRHKLHSFPMEHMHRSWPMMNAMVWHEPVQFQIWQKIKCVNLGLTSRRNL